MAPAALFLAKDHVSPTCKACQYYIKGCCFDPKKLIEGYFAAPCFGCKDVEENESL